MAIVKNFWLKNQSKKLAGAVIYQAMGQTRSRELASSVSNPRTTDQMSQRVRWANLVNFYRANKSWMKFAFENKPTNRTDYNQFMSLNAGTSKIYLPKSLATQGACIVDNYIMTQGSLPSIENNKVTGSWRTNLYLPVGSTLPNFPTVAEWTQALLQANPALREGDQVSFIRFTQQTSSDTGTPFVIVRKYEVVLSSTNFRQFSEYMPADYITEGGTVAQPCLEVTDSGLAGGWVLILSRTIGGKTYVSSQSIVVANNSAMIEQYSSDAALQAAIDSYGESTEPFLTSTTANVDSNAPVAPSVVYVKLGDNTYTPGSIAFPIPDLTSKTIEIGLSSMPEEGFVEMSMGVTYGGNTSEVTEESLTKDGNTLKGTLQGDLSQFEGWAMADILLQFDGPGVRGVFVVPNEATIGGLE